jgi:hypothetical protein
LGKADRINELEIRWPSGRLDRFTGVPVNRRLKFVEGNPKFA